MSRLSRRWKGVLYFFAIALGFSYLAYSGHRSSAPAWHQRAVLRVVGPASQWLRRAGGWIAAPFEGFGRWRGLHQKNQELQAQLLQSQASQSALREELYRLSLLLKLQESPVAPDSEAVVAKVVGYDPSLERRSLWIDRGLKDGFELDQAVVDERGVVGRIYKLGEHSSQVLLLTDRHSVVDVVVQSSRARGTLTGITQHLALNRERWLTQAEYLNAQEEVRAGDLMDTSGLDGLFPAGLPVGTVSLVKKDASGLFQTAEVVPQAELMKLEAVRVLPHRRAEGR